MLAREHLWRLAPARGGATTAAALGRWRWLRYRYVLAIPLLLALEVAAAIERRLQARTRGEPAWVGLPSTDAEEAARWRERRFAAARVRYRLRRGRWAAAALGGLAACFAIAWQLASPLATWGRLDGASALGGLALLALATAVPWLLVDLLRRWTERRYYWEWQ